MPTSYSPFGLTDPSANIFEQSANNYSAGTDAMRFAVNPMSVMATMNQYLNPYQDQVISDVLGRMRDEGDIALNNVRGQAVQSSAYGGARQGLVEAELIDRLNRNMGETAGQLAHQGFTTAANFGQNRIGQIMTGGTGLVNAAGQGLGMGQSIADKQMQSGMMQQSIMQQILDQAAGQYDAFANYPQTALTTALAGVSGNPLAASGRATSQYKPGLFDYLSMGMGIMGGGK